MEYAMLSKIKPSYLIVAISMLLTGFLSYGVIRFVFVKDEHTHYHANFAVYIDGRREKFDNFTFYEEVTSCSDAQSNNPKSRVHMHENINSLVHVHDDAVTWSHFFSNLGYTLADKVLITPSKKYEETDSMSFRYILNGKEVGSIYDRLIESRDRLLISYGSISDDNLMKLYNTVPSDAAEYNLKPDPSSCGGADKASFKDRFIRTQLK